MYMINEKKLNVESKYRKKTYKTNQNPIVYSIRKA